MSIQRSIAVLGSGGIGGLCAVMLAHAGFDVTVVTTERSAAAINTAGGITLHSHVWGEIHAPLTAVTELTHPVDLSLITVKHTGLSAALDLLPPHYAGVVIPFLNGIEHLSILRNLYGDSKVCGATIKVESTRTAPTEIAHTSSFCVVSLAQCEQAGWVSEVLSSMTTSVTIEATAEEVLWNKMAVLAPMALLTAGLKETVGRCRDEHTQIYDAAISEAVEVARASGASVDLPTVQKFFRNYPYDGSTSMARDIAAGRPSELDAIGGAILRAAKAHRLTTPALEELYAKACEAAGSPAS